LNAAGLLPVKAPEVPLQKLAIALTAVALAFLAFIAGATITRFELFPYAYLKNAFEAAEALVVLEQGDWKPVAVGAKPVHPEDWAAAPLRQDASGLGRYVPDKVFAGYTVYTAINAQFPVRLIDMQGNTVHQWQVPFDALDGPRDDGLDLRPTLQELTVAYAGVQPNGDLIAVLGTAGYTPWGIGIIKLDRDSNLLWKYMKQAHHDVSVAPDGTIYAMLHTTEARPRADLPAIATPFIDDHIVVLSPAGDELALYSMLDALAGSAYESVLQFADPEHANGDLLHLNSITYLDDVQARSLPNARGGDVLISLREVDVLGVFNPETATLSWATRGPWHMQHDPDLLPDGRMLVFDNKGDIARGGTSRVLEFDPKSLQVTWEYPADTGERLYTSIYGSQQRLPNGNTLISESNNGRLLEVTRDKEVVWEYFIPERTPNRRNVDMATAVFGERFAPDELDFLDALR
jgi:hypothetical protein